MIIFLPEKESKIIWLCSIIIICCGIRSKVEEFNVIMVIMIFLLSFLSLRLIMIAFSHVCGHPSNLGIDMEKANVIHVMSPKNTYSCHNVVFFLTFFVFSYFFMQRRFWWFHDDEHEEGASQSQSGGINLEDLNCWMVLFERKEHEIL